MVSHMEGTSSLLDVPQSSQDITSRPVIFTVLWVLRQELSESVLQIGIPCLRPVMWLTQPGSSQLASTVPCAPAVHYDQHFCCYDIQRLSLGKVKSMGKIV